MTKRIFSLVALSTLLMGSSAFACHAKEKEIEDNQLLSCKQTDEDDSSLAYFEEEEYDTDDEYFNIADADEKEKGYILAFSEKDEDDEYLASSEKDEDDEYLASGDKEEDDILACYLEEEQEELFASCADGKCPREMIERLRREKQEQRARGKYRSDSEYDDDLSDEPPKEVC